METNIPGYGNVLTTLLKADFTTQWRNRRAVVLVLLVPVLILISWKGLVDKLGGAFVLSNCITVGLMATGMMGYSNAISRDRDKAIFQRLRAAPIPSWSIIASRLAVQLVMILVVNLVVFIAGYYADHIQVSMAGYILCIGASVIGGAVYLGLGQLIVGLIKNPETVNATTRLVYFVFIMVGMFGELGMLGDSVSKYVKYSPYGAVKHIVSASLTPATWNHESSISLLLTVGYAILFGSIGISKFQWNTK